MGELNTVDQGKAAEGEVVAPVGISTSNSSPNGRLSRAEVMREVLAILQEEEEQEKSHAASAPEPPPPRLPHRQLPLVYSHKPMSLTLPMQGVFLRVGVVDAPPLVYRQKHEDLHDQPINDQYGGKTHPPPPSSPGPPLRP